jgi:hypothetical protein
MAMMLRPQCLRALPAILVVVVGCDGTGLLVGSSDAGTDGALDPARDEDRDSTDVPGDRSWLDVEEEATVLEPVGPPVTLDDGTLVSSPAVAWNGEGWGIAWGSHFMRLDEMGVPLCAPVALEIPDGGVFDIEWRIDHYAIAFGVIGRDSILYVATIDEEGELIAGPTLVGESLGDFPDLEWSDDANAWLVGLVQDSPESGWEGRILVAKLDDEVTLTGGLVDVGLGERDAGPRVVALKTRSAMVWPVLEFSDSGGEIWYRSFDWPDVDASPPPRLAFHTTLGTDSRIVADGFFDDTIVVTQNGSEVLAAVLEPLGGTVVSGPVAIGHTSINTLPATVTAVETRGYLGVCYPYGPGVGRWIFRLIGRDAYPLGAEVGLEPEILGGLCAVGWNGSEFIVLYEAGHDDSRHLYAQRVRPLI